MKRSHYDILGINPGAPPEVIERAHRALIARAARASGAEAEALRREVDLAREAFAELMDPDRHRAYDARIGVRAGRQRSVQSDGPRQPGALERSDDWRVPTVMAGVVALLAIMGLGGYALAEPRLRAPEVHLAGMQNNSSTAVFSYRLGGVSPGLPTGPAIGGGR